MKKYLIILVLIFTVVGCADDDKGNKSSNNIQDNTSYDNNTGYTYHVVVDSVSYISKDDNMSQGGYLPCEHNSLTEVFADKLGRPIDNTTKVYYVTIRDGYSYFTNNSDIVRLYDNDDCYNGLIFRMEIKPYMPTSISMQYMINQIKTNSYENRYQEDVYITVDENGNIVEIK